jgi:magnesium chelatase subunit I
MQGLLDHTRRLGLGKNESDAVRAAAGEFILEGLCAQRRISRTEEWTFQAGEKKRNTTSEEKPRPDRRNYQ